MSSIYFMVPVRDRPPLFTPALDVAPPWHQKNLQRWKQQRQIVNLLMMMLPGPSLHLPLRARGRHEQEGSLRKGDSSPALNTDRVE
jgi:hypothetical protein